MSTGRPDDQLPREATAILAAAREIQNCSSCFVGVGTPSQAALVAVRTHAPDAFLIYESGALDTRPERPPLSVADHDVIAHARSVIPVAEVFNCWLQGGRVDIGLVGAAQIDRYGNINSTVAGGDYSAPTVRLPGAGGAPTIGGFAGRTVVLTKHTTASLVEAVDFVTTPGWTLAGDRERCGLPGAGATTVITDLGVLRKDHRAGTLRLQQHHLGVTVEEVRDRTGWSVELSEQLTVTPTPSPDEFVALRSVIGDS